MSFQSTKTMMALGAILFHHFPNFHVLFSQICSFTLPLSPQQQVYTSGSLQQPIDFRMDARESQNTQ